MIKCKKVHQVKISVITPFYKGNKYLPKYFECLQKNKEHLQCELEVILVNDSPAEVVDVGSCGMLDVKVINLEINSGIHFARVKGLKQATGEYVMLLDQDDLLADDALNKLFSEIVNADADLVISNAELEQKDDSVLWYRTDYHKSLVWDKKTYINVGNQIMSPGQCLIKKSEIPEKWCENILKNNCCDDYYLWLLMIDKAKVSYLDESLYVHSYTGSNVSADTEITYVSSMEMIHYLRRDESLTVNELNTLYKMVDYKYKFKLSGKFKKLVLSIRNLSIVLTNIMYKKKTQTAYGFNRY